MENKFTIRPIREADHAAVLDIYAPYITHSVVSFEYEVPSLETFSRRITDITAFYPWLVAVVDGRIAGYAYAGPHRARKAYGWSSEVSVYLDAAYHRRGIARKLYQVLFQILRLQGMINVYAGITLPNPASESLHAAMGFRDIGVYRNTGFKMDAWHDVKWMSLSIGVHTIPPAMPVSWSTLEDAQDFVSLFS